MTYDVILIGAGPIGIEMATVLKRTGLDYLHLESGPIGNTITRWPRNTQFFSSPEWIAISGIPIQTPGQEIVTGETYLAYLRQVVEIFDLDVNTYERVTSVSGHEGAFDVVTSDLAGHEHRYEGKTVVLATGDMNRPRRIGVRGEELPHVTHYWSDPHLYHRRRLLIVGGRNSAVEAALRCWRAGVQVAMSYRGALLDEKRLISRLHLEIDLLVRNGQIDFFPLTEPIELAPGRTVLRGIDAEANLRETARAAHGGKTRIVEAADEHELKTDFVYLATGFEMDQSLYEQLGIETEGEERRPVHDPATMESNVSGVFVVGTSIGGNQRGYKVFITTSHEHCTRAAREIQRRLVAEEQRHVQVSDAWVGNHSSRDYPLSSKDVE
ncbi:MAG: NAD(P)-binding domain-containing protein [Spirochaetota bacterium]